MYCWAQYPWVLFLSLAVTLDSTETPFAKTPFSWFLTIVASAHLSPSHPLPPRPPVCHPPLPTSPSIHPSIHLHIRPLQRHFLLYSVLCAAVWELPSLVVSNLAVCNFYALSRSFVPFCALLRSFADLRLLSSALICALLRAFVCFCVRLRLERPRLGTTELLQ